MIAPWPGLAPVRAEIEAVIAAYRGSQERDRQRWAAAAQAKAAGTKPVTQPPQPESVLAEPIPAPTLEPVVPETKPVTKPKNKGGRPRVHADTAARVAAWRARHRDDTSITKPPGRPRKWASDAERKAAWRARQRDEKSVTELDGRK